MPHHDCIEITRDARGVACVTIANAAKLNTLNRAVMTALIDAVEVLAGDSTLRAVVLRGAGTRAFIGGADISDEPSAVVLRTLDGLTDEEKSDYGMVKEKVRADLKRLIQKTTGRRPMIMPVILEI